MASNEICCKCSQIKKQTYTFPNVEFNAADRVRGGGGGDAIQPSSTCPSPTCAALLPWIKQIHCKRGGSGEGDGETVEISASDEREEQHSASSASSSRSSSSRRMRRAAQQCKQWICVHQQSTSSSSSICGSPPEHQLPQHQHQASPVFAFPPVYSGQKFLTALHSGEKSAPAQWEKHQKHRGRLVDK